LKKKNRLPMAKRVVFLHTISTVLPLFTQLAKTTFPADVEFIHIVDEMLLRIVLAQGGLSPFIHRRVAEHAAAVEQGGYDLLQVTCSSISPCVDTAAPVVSIPVLKIDQPMAERAVELGTKIGVLATAPTTLNPTTSLVCSIAERQGKTISIEPVLCSEAYTALFAGDQTTHDRLVRENVLGLALRVDVVLLAQASMARVLETIDPGDLPVPVLTSPELALKRTLLVLDTL
jgi:Asp/Glu/hydantoin racemase